MSGSGTIYAARFLGPEIMEAGRDNVLTCSIYQGSGLVLPTSATLTVIDPNNTTLVSARTATLPSSVCTCTVTSSELSTYTPEDGWRFEWAAVIGGVTHTFTRTGSLVYRRLYPPVAEVDLLREHSDLVNRKPRQKSSYQDYIDAALADLESMMVKRGVRPWLIMSSDALYVALLYRSLEKVYGDFATSPDSMDWVRMMDYRQLFASEWATLTFEQRDPATGAADDRGRRSAMTPTIWMCNRSQRL